MKAIHMTSSTPCHGFYVDVKPVVEAFNPWRSDCYHYTTSPVLRKVVAEVTVERIIECIFIIPAHNLQDNGLPGTLLSYIEHNCPAAMDTLKDNTDLLINFDCLVNDVVELLDLHLRQVLASHTNHYEKYVFDHWAAQGLAAFMRYDNES